MTAVSFWGVRVAETEAEVDSTPLFTRTVARADERLVALIVAGAIAAFGVLGSVSSEGVHGFDLDAEVNFPSAFSAFLLFAAGALTIIGGQTLGSGRARVAWFALGVGYVFLGFDEFFEVHEALERATSVDWQLLYVPAAVVLAPAFVLVLRAVWPIALPRQLLLAGVAAWIAAQVLEQVQWDGDRRVSGYRPMMISEELLEMAGSALFALAMLSAIRAADKRFGATYRRNGTTEAPN
jgi:hypothetical protein